MCTTTLEMSQTTQNNCNTGTLGFKLFIVSQNTPNEGCFNGYTVICVICVLHTESLCTVNISHILYHYLSLPYRGHYFRQQTRPVEPRQYNAITPLIAVIIGYKSDHNVTSGSLFTKDKRAGECKGDKKRRQGE